MHFNAVVGVVVAVVVKDVVVVGVVVVIGVVVGVVDVVVGVNVLGVVGVVDASVGPFPDPSPSPEANTSVAAGVIVVDRPGVVVVWSFPGIGLFLNEYEFRFSLSNSKAARLWITQGKSVRWCKDRCSYGDTTSAQCVGT